MKTTSDAEPSLFSDSDLRIELSFLLGDVARRLRALFDLQMKGMGLSRAQWRALVFLLRLKAPSQTQLAEALDIGRAATGVIIDQLESAGFAARTQDPADRRVWRIVPTKAAINSMGKLDKAANIVAQKAFDGLNPEELSMMFALLTKLQLNLS